VGGREVGQSRCQAVDQGRRRGQGIGEWRVSGALTGCEKRPDCRGVVGDSASASAYTGAGAGAVRVGSCLTAQRLHHAGLHPGRFGVTRHLSPDRVVNPVPATVPGMLPVLTNLCHPFGGSVLQPKHPTPAARRARTASALRAPEPRR